MRARLAALISALVLLPALHGATDAPEATEGRSWDDYEVLVERNMFSRQRGRRTVEATTTVVRAAPSPERYVLLRGVVAQGESHIAVFEDMRSGRIIRAAGGDSVARGHVVEVTMDSVRYAQGDNEVEIAIGENLEKGAITSYVPPPSDATAAAGAAGDQDGPPAPAASSTGEGGGDLLERLRQKRMKELGQ